MKHLFILLTLVSLSASAQIEVKEESKRVVIGSVKSGASMIAELYYRVNNYDTVYYLMYENAKYQSITDIQIIPFVEGKTVTALYDILMRAANGEAKEFVLGKTSISVEQKKALGVKSVLIITPDGWLYLTEKQIKKLFAK